MSGFFPRQQRLPIRRPFGDTLLHRDDTPTDLPISSRHRRINAACRSQARGFNHADDFSVQSGISVDAHFCSDMPAALAAEPHRSKPEPTDRNCDRPVPAPSYAC
ncbi:unnamed protein product (plasmid) [Mycetohabitans rhizoxinica HKI 454]|uniref:Uncharacterized protein n=1 Tax=Mycetohabitans rhizoxinica (strain DSM 19002 / CIP 109453 / HKI 454) TaxID=882378 RepID=E5AVP2_MYCRK|nr:unnamed protein product [Mycetohabitans rhizoxinica HKI 454]